MPFRLAENGVRWTRADTDIGHRGFAHLRLSPIKTLPRRNLKFAVLRQTQEHNTHDKAIRTGAPSASRHQPPA
eukprot:3891291-Prymnesium_polylepis.1